MKVLHLSSEKTWRGGEQQIAYLIQGLSELGAESIVAAREKSAFHEYCQKMGIECMPLPFRNSIDVITAKAIGQICKAQNVDIVHMHSSKSHSIAVLSAVMGNKVPLVLSRRVDFVPGNAWFTRWKYNHPSIRRIIGVSNKITEIMKAYVADNQKCITIHSGVDLDKFSLKPKQNVLRTEFNIPDDAFIIGNTSALENHKDYPTFITTIELLHKQQKKIHAFIIGSGSLENELRRLCEQKGIGHLITFTGFRNDLTTVLPGLDAFLMTSKEEGLGTSILDAFLAGVPVVATRAGGIPEMVVNKETGLLADVGNAQQLGDGMISLMTNDALRKRLIEGAWQKVKKEFSRQHTAEKTLQAYRELTESDKRS